MSAHLALPEGRRGQVLAAGLGLAGLLVLWAGLLAPIFGWYESRAEALVAQRALAAHMQALAEAAPALRAALARQSRGGAEALLSGDSDAIAAANLQSMLQEIAAGSGAGLQSVAPVAVQPLGNLRKIGLLVSLSGDWPQFIAFLAAAETATPRMVVEDLALTTTALADPGGDIQLQASFTVSAFRPAASQ
jgi:general secretion pathway protein M